MWFWEAELASGKLFAKQMLPVFKAQIKVSRFQPKGSRLVCLYPLTFLIFSLVLATIWPKNDVMHRAAAH